ncbi:9782_t:CDS:10 [Diversispora eburnea]|uniref:GPN-loop GTPase 3 n=1 Tax=Diversispora eburnea TaxID=1213867 RepID=A0A9N9A928_9GLOM|nr:9782_t:CDS:10 [Diversispora eburnea]
MKFSPKNSIYDLTKLPGANNFFGNITSLSTYKILDSIILEGLAKICHSIKDIYINCDETNYEGWSTLLNSQSNLLHLKIRTKNTNIPLIKNALMNKVNTLISLSLIPICLSMNIFINCPNLHELEIMENPNFVPNNELYQFLSVIFPNLEFLSIKLLNSSILFPYFSTFIQNHSKTLKYLSVTCFQKHLLIKPDYLLTYSTMLIEFCSNLLEYIGPISIKHISSLFDQCSNLYRISLLSNDHYNISICSELEEIGNLLPKNLVKLKIPSEYKFTANSLERFLQCCEDKLVKELELDISRYSLDLQIILEKYRMKGVLNKIWTNSSQQLSYYKRSRYVQLVMGPAGSGKSTYCATLMTHCQNIGRTVHLMNLDPAAEKFEYDPSIDIRDLITLEDVMDELQYGPNGDWLEDELGEYENDYLIIDCQIELYTHFPIMRRICECLQRLNFRICGVYLLESQFIVDKAKYFAGVLSATSAMISLEIPHINVLSKMDLLEPIKKKELKRYYDPDPTLLEEEANASMNSKFHNLNRAIVQLIEDYNMVSFIPLNINNEDSITAVLSHIDNAIQYGEDQEPKEPKDEIEDFEDFEGY